MYEDRADLLQAVIKGPQGTPYADGLFFFDVQLPAEYPDVPPRVYYHAHGDRVNPNLYENGKVCLSLLGTWAGSSVESWDPKKSNILQVSAAHTAPPARPLRAAAASQVGKGGCSGLNGAGARRCWCRSRG